MRRFFSVLLPLFGASGFVAFSELSLRRPAAEFYAWSLATLGWTLTVFAVLAIGRLKGRLLGIALPAIAMIAVSTTASLLFLDMVSPRRGFIAFFAIVLYLFLEHVRHEISRPGDAEERLYISEFARMVNIGSLFLLATVGLGVTIFLPVPSWWVVSALAAVALLWSWHLFAACRATPERTLSRVLLSTLAIVETFLVALRLPTSMFVGGAMVGIVYYLASGLLPAGPPVLTEKTVRRYFVTGVLLMLAILLTARWFS